MGHSWLILVLNPQPSQQIELVIEMNLSFNFVTGYCVLHYACLEIEVTELNIVVALFTLKCFKNILMT